MLDRRHIDPNSLSVSVLDCGGRENLAAYLRLVDELRIEPFVITDGDASKIKDNDTKQGTSLRLRLRRAVECSAFKRTWRQRSGLRSKGGRIRHT
jgi:predicted ATP-dependent endonuclease of OLD family